MGVDGRVLVVRKQGSWFLAPVGSTEPQHIDLDELLTRLDGSTRWDVIRSGPGGRPRTRSSVASDEVVRLAWIVIGAIDGDRLVVADLHGGVLALDRVDLAVIDALVEPRSAEQLAPVVGEPVDVVRERLEVLSSAGVVRTLPPTQVADAPAEPPSAAPPAPGTAARLRSRLSTVVRSWRARREATRSAPAGEAPEPEVRGPKAPAPALHAPAPATSGRDRIPVYAIWHEAAGPLLSTGMLTAYARVHDGGRLNEVFEIRRPETADSFLRDLATRSGPAILLCSDYVWCFELNLQAARQAKEINPQLVVIHGGPSSPKYAGDAERFLDEHGDVADVLVRGEGELVLAQVLEVLARSLPDLGRDELAGIGGLTFRSETGEVVRTPDQERIATLDMLPSPYLTGEFDDIPAEAWNQVLAIESNRGCPYGCTFCDWGSSTLSRIRKFDIDRVVAELEWAASRGVGTIDLTDANFGIMSRDVEIARRLADIKRRTGHPNVIVFYPAKNTTKHLVAIMDHIIDSGMLMAACLALQSADEATLTAIHRDNISTEAYLRLAGEMRRRGLPLQAELIAGLPGQTVESYRRDLQFLSDHEIIARTYTLRVLPNAPINDPQYRAEHGVVYDEDFVVVSTSTFTREDLGRMLEIRRAHLILEQAGILRHVLRYLQWEHGLESTAVVIRLMDAAAQQPSRYPLIDWTLSYFDHFPAPPLGWTAVFAEVRRFLRDELDVPDSPQLDMVLALQEFLLPAPNRTLPATMELPHDYVAYRRSAMRQLYRDGTAGRPDRPLAEYPPAELTIDGDPLEICSNGVYIWGDSRDPTALSDFNQLTGWAYELLSPLVAPLPMVVNKAPRDYLTAVRLANAGLASEEELLAAAGDADPPRPTPVRLSAQRG